MGESFSDGGPVRNPNKLEFIVAPEHIKNYDPTDPNRKSYWLAPETPVNYAYLPGAEKAAHGIEFDEFSFGTENHPKDSSDTHIFTQPDIVIGRTNSILPKDRKDRSLLIEVADDASDTPDGRPFNVKISRRHLVVSPDGICRNEGRNGSVVHKFTGESEGKLQWIRIPLRKPGEEYVKQKLVDPLSQTPLAHVTIFELPSSISENGKDTYGTCVLYYEVKRPNERAQTRMFRIKSPYNIPDWIVEEIKQVQAQAEAK